MRQEFEIDCPMCEDGTITISYSLAMEENPLGSGVEREIIEDTLAAPCTVCKKEISEALIDLETLAHREREAERG